MHARRTLHVEPPAGAGCACRDDTLGAAWRPEGEGTDGDAELGGMRGAWFRDPEGNILSVVQLPAA